MILHFDLHVSLIVCVCVWGGGGGVGGAGCGEQLGHIYNKRFPVTCT